MDPLMMTIGVDFFHLERFCLLLKFSEQNAKFCYLYTVKADIIDTVYIIYVILRASDTMKHKFLVKIKKAPVQENMKILIVFKFKI